MSKRRISALVVVMSMIVLSICSCGKKDEPAVTSSSSAKKVVKEEKMPSGISLLTGLPLDEKLDGQRPIAIMIENTKSALPHSNINKASIVYECPVEGGITRYMALYDDYRDMEKIGNVRSARPYYVYIASEYNAVYLHMGGSVHALELIASTGIVNDFDGISSGGVAYYATDDKPKPHNTYTSTEGIDKGFDALGYSKTYDDVYPGHFKFAKEENLLEDGEDVVALDTYFFTNKPYFIYDEETKTYKRYEFNAPETDEFDENQMAYTNIIYQNITSSLYEETEYLNIPLVGSGKGKFLTNGKMIDITWQKDSDTDITHYYTLDGDEIELNKGKTWISLVEEGYIDKNHFYSTMEEFENRNTQSE